MSDFGQTAFNAGKRWITGGHRFASGVSNANATNYGFSKWYNSIPPSVDTGSTKARLLKDFKEGVAAGKRLENEALKMGRKGNPCMTSKRRNGNAEVRELEIFIENDGGLYRSQGLPIIKNLTAKKASGKFNITLAAKLYGYLVDNGAKKYAREFGEASDWNRTFSVADRKEVAKRLAHSFEAEFNSGAYNEYIPKKYQAKANPGKAKRAARAILWAKDRSRGVHHGTGKGRAFEGSTKDFYKTLGSGYRGQMSKAPAYKENPQVGDYELTLEKRQSNVAGVKGGHFSWRSSKTGVGGKFYVTEKRSAIPSFQGISSVQYANAVPRPVVTAAKKVLRGTA